MRLRTALPTLTLLALTLTALLTAQATTNIADLKWIAGDWSGPVGRSTVEEHWIAPAGGAMLGMSRTLSNDKMVAFEFLRIEARPDGIFYVAQPQGRPPTDFKLTKSTATMAVFENPQHDNPKIITYALEGNGLLATVEGERNGKQSKQAFRMERITKP